MLWTHWEHFNHLLDWSKEVSQAQFWRNARHQKWDHWCLLVFKVQTTFSSHQFCFCMLAELVFFFSFVFFTNLDFGIYIYNGIQYVWTVCNLDWGWFVVIILSSFHRLLLMSLRLLFWLYSSRDLCRNSLFTLQE